MASLLSHLLQPQLGQLGSAAAQWQSLQPWGDMVGIAERKSRQSIQTVTASSFKKFSVSTSDRHRDTGHVSAVQVIATSFWLCWDGLLTVSVMILSADRSAAG